MSDDIFDELQKNEEKRSQENEKKEIANNMETIKKGLNEILEKVRKYRVKANSEINDNISELKEVTERLQDRIKTYENRINRIPRNIKKQMDKVDYSKLHQEVQDTVDETIEKIPTDELKRETSLLHGQVKNLKKANNIIPKIKFGTATLYTAMILVIGLFLGGYFGHSYYVNEFNKMQKEVGSNVKTMNNITEDHDVKFRAKPLSKEQSKKNQYVLKLKNLDKGEYKAYYNEDKTQISIYWRY